MRIVFWEKPGCAGNARQRALLVQAGHELDVRSLPGAAWTRAALLEWLDALPVPQWFNRRSPRVTSGEVDPDALDRDTALDLLVADPLLVRRPLLEVAGVKLVGFELPRIEALAGALPDTERVRGLRAGDPEGCPAEATGAACTPPRAREP